MEGEDLNFKERTKKQKEQVRDLLLQQMQEKRMKNYIENKDEHDWESMLLKQDNKALQTAMAQQSNNKAKAQELSNKNKYLVNIFFFSHIRGRFVLHLKVTFTLCATLHEDIMHLIHLAQ